MGSDKKNYLDINKAAWDKRTAVHLESDFYDNESFIEGRNSLNRIELDLLGDIEGKSVLHLQCHFGQDTISLARLGASATGIDISEASITAARELNEQIGKNCDFIRSDVYSLPDQLDRSFDLVFSSYGTIGWLPDIQKWAGVVSHFLKPGGMFVFAEFHPVVWMFSDDFSDVHYKYSSKEPIEETTTGTYGDPGSDISADMVSWNHGLADVIQSLIDHGLRLEVFREYDYSPYDCFQGTEEFEPGKFRIKRLGDKIPMVYALRMRKD